MLLKFVFSINLVGGEVCILLVVQGIDLFSTL